MKRLTTLPYRGGPQKRPWPFEKPGNPGWWKEHWRPNDNWCDKRIEAELRAFIGDRDEWPTQTEFRGGHSKL